MAEFDIAITGFSGRLPESSNMEEFKKNLFSGIDMVNKDPKRWPKGFYGIPDPFGTIKDQDLEYFDQQFFNVHTLHAEHMDPQMRMLLEATYEAIIDAGVNPQEIRGSKTGVYVGVSASDIEYHWCFDADRASGYEMTGCARCMFANRISFSFDFKGPSMAIDSACSSSAQALCQAFHDIKYGVCEAAIVCGSNLILHPVTSLHFHRMGLLNVKGMCAVFDADCAGYARSDGCAVIFLQKAINARRIYANVLNAKANIDGSKENGLFHPSGEMQQLLVKETYEEIGLNLTEVTYMEAHGTGTKVGDVEEINAIADHFCKSRTTPLLIGSVKSNLGHTEAASGIVSIAKIILAMESEMIPGNLHFNTPNPKLYGITDGRLEVVNKNKQSDCSLVGVSSFGFGGANAHIILKHNTKRKNLKTMCGLPRLILASGRTEDCVQKFLEEAETHSNDEEYISLINEVYKLSIPMHLYRGYSILGGEQPQREVINYVDEKRPIWFIYSGMGSQWVGMGKAIMDINVCKASIQRSATVLKKKGFDLIEILTKDNNEIRDNILYSFVTITAIQIALTDLLTLLGITPDGIVGHSLGEIACSYGDGSLTAEQAILGNYYRGKCVLDTEVIPGKMASIGLTLEECKTRLPNDVFPVCHNSVDNVTISGPADTVNKFISQLMKEGIFAKLVNSSDIAFHCKYIADIAPKLLDKLQTLIPNPKERTSRWLSTSIPENEWHLPLSHTSSASYFVNNLLSPVLFHEALQHIPKNAICIEIAPHGLLQPILRRSLDKDITNISLLQRNNKNNLHFLLSNIGRLYGVGAQPNILKLYPPVLYPVSRGTPMLNSTIGWDHSHHFEVPKLGVNHVPGEKIIDINLKSEKWSYLVGHSLNGHIIFPATALLHMAWRIFAKANNSYFKNTAVIFEDFVIHKPTVLGMDASTKFKFVCKYETGKFKINVSNELVASGKISMLNKTHRLDIKELHRDGSNLSLNATDVYTELRLRGFEYNGEFCGIVASDLKFTNGRVLWNDNWITLMDTLLQFWILGLNSRELKMPTRIGKVIIDPTIIESLQQSGENVPVSMSKSVNIIKSCGIEIHEVTFTQVQQRRLTHAAPVLERYTFSPFDNAVAITEHDSKSREYAVTAAVHLVIENCLSGNVIKIVDVTDDNDIQNNLANTMEYIVDSEPTFRSNITIITNKPIERNQQHGDDSTIRYLCKNPQTEPIGNTCHLVVGYNILSLPNVGTVLRNFRSSLCEEGFILLEEELNERKYSKLFTELSLVIVSTQRSSNKIYILLRPIRNIAQRDKQIVFVTDKSYSWLNELKTALATARENNKYIYIVSQSEENAGIMGLFNCLKKEYGATFLRLVFIQDQNIEKFSFGSKFYSNQLQKDLSVNVFRQGMWGSFRHFKLDIQLNEPRLDVEHAYVNVLTVGDLTSLRWIESPLSRQLYDQHNLNLELCTVYYAPINFKDVMLSIGKLSIDSLPGNVTSNDCFLGLEFSGRDSNGERIMALVPSKSLATTCVANRKMIWKIPEEWTMEQASTVPCVYSTVYYGLFIRGKIRKGETILIHAGSGGVGQAAISVALHHGLIVYTTVSSIEKREYLKKEFPQLTDWNISNSRDTSFVEFVMEATGGKGVDLVLNSLSEEKLLASVRCLGLNGRFLEIGKVDLNNNNPLGMSVFLKNTAFHGIHLDNVMAGDEETIKDIVSLVSDGIKSGAVRPLRTSIFNKTEIESAFRFMASGKHIGKVVIKIRDEEPEKCVHQIKPAFVKAIPKTYMDKNKSYIIIGGLGGFGLEFASWMVERGVRNLILTSRNGIQTGYQKLIVQKLKELGANVIIKKASVSSIKEAHDLLNEINLIAPVGGIFNLAGILCDAILENLNENDFKQVCFPKLNVTQYLDIASRVLCPILDYFICFSSVVSGRGNIGQCNYGMANSSMERICENRQMAGFPATSVQWGAIGDVGMVVRSSNDNITVVSGTLPQRVISCLHTLDIFMQQPNAVLSSIVISEKRKSNADTGVSLVKYVANILGIKDLKNTPDHLTLRELGIDSLMIAEVKSTFERCYNITLSITEIREISFGKLKTLESGNDETSATKTKTSTKETLNFNSLPELMPTETLVHLPSKAAADSTQRPLFIIHPVEGFINALIPLASKMNCPVWGLQCTEDAPLNSITELAEYYLKHIRSIQTNGPYFITGYSFGGIVALELTAQLEAECESVTMVTIDGSQNYMKSVMNLIQNQANKESTDILYDYIVLSWFGMHCFNLDYVKTAENLKQLSTFDSRMRRLCELVKSITNYDLNQISNAALSFYKRNLAVYNYKPIIKVKTKITLIKATTREFNIVADYGLSEFCTEKVNIITVEGTHQSILTGKSLQKVVDVLQQLYVDNY